MRPLTYEQLDSLVRSNPGNVFVDLPALGAVQIHSGSLLKLLDFSGTARLVSSGYAAQFHENNLVLCYRERRVLKRKLEEGQ